MARSSRRAQQYISGYLQFRDLLDDLAVLPDDILGPIKAMVKTAANNERKKVTKLP